MQLRSFINSSVVAGGAGGAMHPPEKLVRGAGNGFFKGAKFELDNLN